MIKIYGDFASGNSYKIKLLTFPPAIPHKWITINILSGETQSESFKAINPAAEIPLLQLDDSRHLPQSSAIFHLFAEGSDFFLTTRTITLTSCNSSSLNSLISPYALYLGLPDNKREEYKTKQAGGHNA